MSLRPRPIDIFRPMPLYTNGIPEDEELLLMEATLDYVPIPEIDIAVPVVKEVDNPIIPKFKRTNIFIRFREKTLEEEKRQIEYDLDSSDDEWLSSVVNRERSLLSENDFEAVIDRFEKRTGFSRELPDFSEMPAIPNISNELLRKIYDYWRAKRLARTSKKTRKLYPCGKPLLVQFEVPPPFDNNDPLVPFRPREKDRYSRKKNDQESFQKLNMLRNELERVRTLMELVLKREKMKKELVILSRETSAASFIEIDRKYNPNFVHPPKKKKQKEIATKPTNNNVINKIPTASSASTSSSTTSPFLSSKPPLSKSSIQKSPQKEKSVSNAVVSSASSSTLSASASHAVIPEKISAEEIAKRKFIRSILDQKEEQPHPKPKFTRPINLLELLGKQQPNLPIFAFQTKLKLKAKRKNHQQQHPIDSTTSMAAGSTTTTTTTTKNGATINNSFFIENSSSLENGNAFGERGFLEEDEIGSTMTTTTTTTSSSSAVGQEDGENGQDFLEGMMDSSDEDERDVYRRGLFFSGCRFGRGGRIILTRAIDNAEREKMREEMREKRELRRQYPHLSDLKQKRKAKKKSIGNSNSNKSTRKKKKKRLVEGEDGGGGGMDENGDENHSADEEGDEEEDEIEADDEEEEERKHRQNGNGNGNNKSNTKKQQTVRNHNNNNNNLAALDLLEEPLTEESIEKIKSISLKIK